MKKVIFLILILFVSYSYSQDTPQRKKVALVLSGGGAKGTAHIGALKVLEQANIPIDMIVGTSMGALMGGLYSIGYNADMLDSLVRVQDWAFLLSDKIDTREMNIIQREKRNTYLLSFALNNIGKLSIGKPGFIKGKNLANLFSKLTLGYHDSIDFNSLPIPFSCVATDIVKFEEIDFHSGNLATAMRASMSIPAVFTPVKMDSMILVDGGLKNNFPVDVAKQMGADIIIGVSVQNEMNKSPEYFNSTFAVLNQLMDVNTQAKADENISQCDVFIKVDITGYSAASFNLEAINELIKRGEKATNDHWQELMGLREKIGITDEDEVLRPKPYRMQNQRIRMKISEVNFVNVDNKDQSFLKDKFNLKSGGTTTIDSIEKAMTALRSRLFYNDVSYQIKYLKDGYGINIETEGKKKAELWLGVRFDNEEKVSMQISGLAPVNFIFPMMLQGTLRLGKRTMFSIESMFNTTQLYTFSLSYVFRRQDLNIYYHANRDLNPNYTQHQMDFKLANITARNFLLDVFVRWDYFRYGDVLYGLKSKSAYLPTSHLWSYHGRLSYDNTDSKYFATKGSKRSIEYALYTDNFYKYSSHAPLHTLSYLFLKNFDLKHNYILETMLYGRSIYGKDMPTVLANCFGGEYFSHYVEQQIPFAGVDNIEIVENNIAALQFTLRKQFLKNNYVSLSASLGYKDDKLKDLFSESPLWGTRLSYSYNSIIGPLGASVGYSNRTKEPYLFVNIGYEF